jgi:hypothetical protein
MSATRFSPVDLCVAATVDFGGGPLAGTGSRDPIVLKLHADGHNLWSKRLVGTALGTARGVAADPNNQVLVAGAFEGTRNFGDGPVANAGGSDGFVVKLDH